MSKKNRRARKRIASKKYIFPKSFFQRKIEERGEKTEKKNILFHKKKKDKKYFFTIFLFDKKST